MQQYFYLENCRESSGVRDIVLSAILTLLCSVILLMIQRWLERRGDKLQKTQRDIRTKYKINIADGGRTKECHIMRRG